MRVIESETVTKGVSMGKKKHKLKKQIRENSNFPDDSSDDSNAGQSCIHVTKALNFSVVKKSIKQSATLGVCSSCEHDKSVRSKLQQDKSCCTASGEELFPGESGVDEDELSYGAVWLCLQCGNQGCDRNSSAQHALKHYKTPHSNSHTLCVNLLSWSVWCYTCDGEVNLKKQKRLVECVDFIHKLSDQQTTGPHPVSSLPTDTNTPTSTTYVASNTPTTTNTEKPEKINLFKARSSSVLAAMPKVKGLSNLGNTCFFNAVMQILSQTSVLESVLSEQSKKGISLSLNSAQLCDSDVSASDSSCEELDKKYIDLDPLTITLPETGLLTQSVLTFLREMNSSSKNGTVSPSALFRQICNKAPRFKGYHEQDSHELLRHLLDGMKAEEIKRSRGGILKSFNLTENTNPKNVNDDIRSKLKAYAKQARHTFVDSIFGGYFISTVQCEDCHYPSQIFEPFQDISLPITEEKPLRPSTLFSAKKQHENSLDSLYQGKSHVDDTTSKHQQKKARKLAKKDSKKRLRAANANNNKVSPLSESVETSGSNEMLVADADVEDNLDSDASRVARATNVSLPSTTAAAASAVGVTAPATTYTDIGPSLGMAPICDISETERITDTSASSNSSVSSTANDLDVTDTHGSSNNNTAAALQTLTSDDRKDSGIDSVADSLSMLSVNGRDSMKSNMSSCGSSSNSGSTNNVALATTNDSTSIHHAGLQHNTVTNSKHKLSTDHIELHKPLSTSASLIQEERLHAKMKAMLTLSNKKHSTLHECSVMSCLNQFTAPELLTGNNKFGCTKCTSSKYGKQSKENKKRVYTNASKQVLVFSPPAVLTLHLKRFQQVGLSLRKVNRHVDFPLVLDLAPYCSALCQRVKFNQHQVLYSLYGVVEHSGRLTSGHYTAYVKVRPNTPNPTVNPATDKLLAFLQRHDQPHAVKLQKIYAQQQQETHKVQNTTAQHPSYPTSNHSNTNNNTTAAAADESAASKEPSVTVAPGKWYHISDSNVSDSTEATVLKCQAYMLFYERVM